MWLRQCWHFFCCMSTQSSLQHCSYFSRWTGAVSKFLPPLAWTGVSIDPEGGVSSVGSASRRGWLLAAEDPLGCQVVALPLTLQWCEEIYIFDLLGLNQCSGPAEGFRIVWVTHSSWQSSGGFKNVHVILKKRRFQTKKQPLNGWNTALLLIQQDETAVPWYVETFNFHSNMTRIILFMNRIIIIIQTYIYSFFLGHLDKVSCEHNIAIKEKEKNHLIKLIWQMATESCRVCYTIHNRQTKSIINIHFECLSFWWMKYQC